MAKKPPVKAPAKPAKAAPKATKKGAVGAIPAPKLPQGKATTKAAVVQPPKEQGGHWAMFSNVPLGAPFAFADGRAGVYIRTDAHVMRRINGELQMVAQLDREQRVRYLPEAKVQAMLTKLAEEMK